MQIFHLFSTIYKLITWPSMADFAELADSESAKLTKPKPLDLCVSLSKITLAVYENQKKRSQVSLRNLVYSIQNGAYLCPKTIDITN